MAYFTCLHSWHVFTCPCLNPSHQRFRQRGTRDHYQTWSVHLGSQISTLDLSTCCCPSGDSQSWWYVCVRIKPSFSSFVFPHGTPPLTSCWVMLRVRTCGPVQRGLQTAHSVQSEYLQSTLAEETGKTWENPFHWILHKGLDTCAAPVDLLSFKSYSL